MTNSQQILREGTYSFQLFQIFSACNTSRCKICGPLELGLEGMKIFLFQPLHLQIEFTSEMVSKADYPFEQNRR